MVLTKKIKGQTFTDLDLLAKLLAPRRPQPSDGAPLIEVIDSEENVNELKDSLVEDVQNLTLEQREILEGMIN